MKNYSRRPGSMLESITFTLLLVIIARLKKVQCSASGRYYIFSSSGSSLPPEDIISSHNIDDEHADVVQLHCAFLCNNEEKCVAFNFRVKRKDKHGVNCQLSNTTKRRKQKCDEEWKLFRYDDATTAASTNGNVTNQFHANFTNLGATGHHGPTSLGSHYVGKDYENMVTLQNGIQSWTVPYTGKYEITAVGSAGGYGRGGLSLARGRGAYMKGEFSLNKGDVVKVLVGQEGVENTVSKSAGGGGGSFVATSSNTPLIVAGGGGGIYRLITRLANCDSSVGTSGRQNQDKHGLNIQWSGGVNGSGALEADSGYSGGGGGGFYSNGRSAIAFGGTKGKGGEGGRGFIQGGAGGRGYNDVVGGFGGGGGSGEGGGGGGGGGGYSGGASGDNVRYSCAGGGGSYNIGKNQENKEEFRASGHGYVEIKLLA